MSYIKRRYFESLKEDPNAIWQYLDCVEKIAYHQFQDSSLIMEEVFCDDINICLVENENSLILERNYIESMEKYFKINRKGNIPRPEEYIKRMIDNGMIVGINTYFYSIPNFTWFHREGYSGDRHICMVVGYDENGFWLTDVPENMNEEYLRATHITTIPYDDMNQYLAKQCNVITFEKKAVLFPICEELDALIIKIIKEYYTPSYSENGTVDWKGREAFERLLYLIKKEDSRLQEMDFFHSEFISYIISGRHDILRRNIIKKHGNNCATEEVLKWLKICQNKWEILGYKILKEIIKKGIYTPIEEDIVNVYESEKVLIEKLELFVKGKGYQDK